MWRSTLTVNTPVPSLILVVAAISFLVTEGGVYIKECEPVESQIPTPTSGNRTISLTCEGLQSDEGAQWAVWTNAANKILLSFICNAQNGSCSAMNPDFQLSRPTPTSSMLTILNNYQKWLGNGNVSCSSSKNSSNIYMCNASAMGPSTPSTPRQQSTSTQVPSTSSTARVQSSSTQGSTSISSTTTNTPTGVQTTTDGEQNGEKDDDGLPIAAIAGGVAAFLVIIVIVIIIVVVVVVRRRKRQKQAHADNNELEEHVNPMYGSGDEPETASPSNSKPSGVALRIPTDTSNNAATLEDADNAIDAGYSSMAFGEQQTTSPASATSPTGQSSPNTARQPGFPTNTTTPVVVTDADLYTAVDGMEQVQTSGPVQDHAAGYLTVGSPNNSATAAPSGDVYAVVQKSGPRAQSASATTTVSPSTPGDSADGAYAFVDVSRSSAPAPSSKAPPGDPVSDNADNTYAVVNKSSSRGKGTGPSTSPDTSNSSQQAPSGDVYAQVDKSSKRNGSTPENDGEGQSYVYAQVDKTSKGNDSTPVQQTQAQDQKPGIKPKPALKPKPSSNV